MKLDMPGELRRYKFNHGNWWSYWIYLGTKLRRYEYEFTWQWYALEKKVRLQLWHDYGMIMDDIRYTWESYQIFPLYRFYPKSHYKRSDERTEKARWTVGATIRHDDCCTDMSLCRAECLEVTEKARLSTHTRNSWRVQRLTISVPNSPKLMTNPA